MQARILGVAALALVSAGMWACGGATFVVGSDAGEGGAGSSSGSAGSGSGSGSGSASGSTSGSGSSGSSSGAGTSSSGSSGGPGGSGSSSSSGGSGGGDGCPAKAPSPGSGCSPVGLDCEYGNNANAQCNVIFSCTITGWQPPTSGGSCPGGMCPLTFDQVPQGMPCSPQGLDCSYLKGQCNCAGTLPVSMGVVWQCSVPAQGCPNPRPRIGAACSQDALACDYGACTGGIELTCQGGYWRQTMTLCPG
jgi:hypothetical protein